MDIPSQRSAPTYTREQTVAALLKKARHMARTISWAAMSSADEADIESDALYGLAKALQTWDPTRGCSLHSYAVQRMEGEVKDGLRARDHLTRSDRQRQKGGEQLDGVRQRPVSIEAITADTGWDILDSPCPDALEDLHQQAADRDQVQAILRFVDLSQDARSSLMLRRYYLEGLTLKQIGAEFGVTESRVSQMMKATINKTRSHLTA